MPSPPPAASQPAPHPSAAPDPGQESAGEPTPAQLRAGADTFGLLSSPVRLHLVWLLANEPADVGTLAQRVGMSIPTVSQHLTKLRLAGVISGHRKGRHHHYAVDDPHVLTLIRQIFDHIAPDGSLAPDPPAATPGTGLSPSAG
ncbi:ArsR/SmtB family transcription factor [Streptomyces hainanensis]|uniref:Transcriptional regulator n=1 Tax=Streptomyces hainanensis TaxID=402648 RepID=A0A4R4T8R1_9ACTN|nr:metalloregulator ArsR/SmtB family transcription factor [Streptomyces hainanensis]TDC72366.1 transcriptional regulator [Streptomyces hainanensis]